MNTSSIVTIVVAIFASTGFWEFLKEWWKAKNKKKSVEDELLLGIAHDRIHFLCKRYLQQGYLTTDDYDNLKSIYEPYKQMGGNGSGKKLFEACEALPLREESK